MRHAGLLRSTRLLPAAALLVAGWAAVAEQVYDVRDYGAEAGGKTLCTGAIQEAIDRCADGGGTVYLPPGTWLSGTIRLRSRVTLRLAGGSILLGSPRVEDYPPHLPAVRSYTDRYVRQSLIAGEDLQHVAIRGPGILDGHGARFRWKEYRNRPYLIRLVGCRDVLVEDVTLRNSAMWMQHYLACDRVRLRNVTVDNHVSYNNDGLDIDACRDVSVSGCMIDSDDDALCLKSTLDRACENVTVTNCVLSSHCNAIKMGTESHGGFQNVTISNCAICAPRRSKAMYGSQRGLAGIALEIVDGGHLDRIAISNVTIQGVTTPIFMRLGNRGRIFKEGMDQPGVGTFRNVLLSNVAASGAAGIGCSITGLPGHPIEGVSLRDVRLSFEGGGTVRQAARQVAELPEEYPECTMFGKLPACGFYCRHVKGLQFHNVRLQFVKPELRPGLVCDDVRDLLVDGLGVQSSPGAVAAIRLVGCREALIRGCRPGPGTFLRLEGRTSGEVTLLGNDFSRAERTVELGPGVREEAVYRAANRGP